MIDEAGYRLNVGVIVVNAEGRLLWARRIGQDAWQFPQGGVHENESPEEALFRELYEELGLSAEDVKILGCTQDWLTYRIPKHMLRHYTQPLCLGQKQKWFMLRLVVSDQKIKLDLTHSPEFDSWRWVDYWYPVDHVIDFKREVYLQALTELEKVLR